MPRENDIYAFPRPDERGPDGMGISEGCNGMSLRDWFAGQAIAGMSANLNWGYAAEECAKRAYAIADAALRLRD